MDADDDWLDDIAASPQWLPGPLATFGGAGNQRPDSICFGAYFYIVPCDLVRWRRRRRPRHQVRARSRSSTQS